MRPRPVGTEGPRADALRPAEQGVEALSFPGLGEHVRAIAALEALDHLGHRAAIALELVFDLDARRRRGLCPRFEREAKANQQP
jgi:hypothetical protein